MAPSTNKLTILQWNVCGLLPRLAELKNYINKAETFPDIICIQETFLKENKNVEIFGYNIERRDRPDGARGGVAILINKNLSYNLIISFPEIEELSIELNLGPQKLKICNIYNPPGNKINEDVYNQIAARSNQILLGDFNAHHPVFGGKLLDPAGRILENIINNNNLCILNDKSGTYLTHSGKTTSIDLTITSNNLAIKCNWSVMDNTMGSDHYPIITTVNENPQRPSTPEPTYIYKKADWQKFSIEATKTFENPLQSPDLTEFHNNIISAIHEAAINTIPSSSHKSDSKAVPYWNQKCQENVKKRNKAHKKMKRSNDLDDCIEYRRLKAVAQRTIREEQQNYWKEYCSSLNEDSKLTSVWRMAKRMGGKNSNNNIPTLIHENKSYTTEQEKANIIAKTLSETSSDSNYSSSFIIHRQQMESIWQSPGIENSTANLEINHLNQDFELHELITAIKSANLHSAPGDDKISYELLKHLPKSALSKILVFYNETWNCGKLIPDWKTATIIPIHKPESNKSLPASYRPISLTPALCKINERLIATRLSWYLEKHNLINKNQSAYRKHRSTIDHLIRLQDAINKAISTNRHTVAIFFDFSKAFDLIWRKGLLYKLQQIGISGKMKRWIEDFLTNRKIKVKLNNTVSTEFPLNNGTPQGSVISPLLFLLMINDYPDPDNTQISTSLFADDSAIWRTGTDLHHTIASLQPHVNRICDWCDTWGFKINEIKTVAMIFTKQKNVMNSTVPIEINGKIIKTVKSAKFLGLTWDQKLNWNLHVENVINKAKSKINLLRALTGHHWGANKTTLLRIYRTLIRPKLEYGIESITTLSKTSLSKLQTVQNICLRICAGAMRSTSADALQQECGELPFKLRQKSALLKYTAKISSSSSNPANDILRDSWENYYGKYKTGSETTFTKTNDVLQKIMEKSTPIEISRTPPWTKKKIDTDMTLHETISKHDTTEIQKSQAIEMMNKYRNHLHIFTDASKQTNSDTGCAFYIPEELKKKQIKLDNSLSITTAELIAIKISLEYIQKQYYRRTKIVIFSDSLSATLSLDAANNNIYNSIETEILEIITKLNQDKQINTTIAWIPSHVGIQASDVVDKLAKQAASKPHIDVTTNEPSAKDIKKSIDAEIDKEWQQQYDDSKTGQHYKQLEPKVSRSVKFVDKNRRKERLITRLRLGKCLLNHYLHQIHLHPTGLCDHCNTPETIEHYLLNCQHSNVFYSNPISLQQALTDDTYYDKIYNRTLQLKRRL